MIVSESMNCLIKHFNFSTLLDRQTVTTFVLSICVCQLALATPAVNGDITLANNRVGTVVVLAAKAKIGIGVPGLFMPKIGIPLNFRTHNVNSVIISGGHVRGDVRILDAHTPSWMILGKDSNINTILVE